MSLDTGQALGILGGLAQLIGAIVAIRAAVKQPREVDAADDEFADAQTEIGRRRRRGRSPRSRGHARWTPTDELGERLIEESEMLLDLQDRSADISHDLIRRLFTRVDVVVGLALVLVGIALQTAAYFF